MTRTSAKYDPVTKATIHVPFSADEEAARDAEEALWNASQVVADRRKPEVDALREQKFANGFTHTDGATYDAGMDARLNVVSVAAGIASGKGLPAGRATIDYWDKANGKHDFDEPGFLTFAAAMRDWVAAMYATARAHKDALDAIAADTAKTEQQRRDAIAAHDITTGWPA